MAYIDIDIEEHLHEVGTEHLIDEIKERAEKRNVTLRSLFADNTLSGNFKEDICDLLGLNHLASNDDIVAELLNKIR